MHAELFDELRSNGFSVGSGELGENITTRGLALLDMPRGTRLRIGREAVVELTGLRNGALVRKSGAMSVVLVGGDVIPGDEISVQLPAEPYAALAPV